MKPYYQHGNIQIFCGDCREILQSLPTPDLVVADPPYGISIAVDNARFSGGTITGPRISVNERTVIIGDDEPFDPSHLLGFKRLVIFGANNFPEKLPTSNGWIVWDKRLGLEDMVGWPLGEAELAWTNITGAVRVFRNQWLGLVRNSERGKFDHPTQKPVALMYWILERWASGLVIDPYLGSGPTLEAAKRLGLPAVGIEIEEKYCEIAAKRLSQEVFDFNPSHTQDAQKW